MTAHLYFQNISYFSVPKNACSTLKHHMFMVENGIRFNGFMANSLIWSVHNIYPSRPFARALNQRMRGHWKFAVIRDPIERLRSVHADKVAGGKWLADAVISEQDRAAGLHGAPSLSEFARDLPRYLEYSPGLKRHAVPQVFYLGTDADYFDRLYRLDELPTLESDLAERLDVKVPPMGHENRTPRHGDDELAEDAARAAREFYADDYRVFGHALAKA